jgi:branched-chain amino acid aminotransferase
MTYINLNGKILQDTEVAVSYDNRAFRYGYGLFETLLVKEGSIALKKYHWERLYDGMRQLYFDIPVLMNEAYFENEILRTVKRNKLEPLCRVRLQVFAGPGGMFESGLQKPEFIIECFPLSNDVLRLNENGLVVGIAQQLQKSMDITANLKSCNALIYAMAAQQAKARKWNDALIVNTTGNIIESCIANVFWIKDDVVFTPPLSEGCVAGIMRRHIMAQLQKHNMAVIESELTETKLCNADEIFLTNAIRHIKWVSSAGNKPMANKRTMEIYSLLFKDVDIS